MRRLLLLGSLLLLNGALARAQSLPLDPKATPETRHLYLNLQRVANQGVMFGHQDDLAYGVGWQYQPGRSDVREVAGDYPAVMGWELGHLELDHATNLDSVPFDRMRGFIQQVYAQGGINTISWHFNNPVDPAQTAWVRGAKEPTIRRLLADPQLMRRYDGWLDRFAAFIATLKGPKGEAIPIIYRPFHENTGSWFWWGKEECTPAEYQQLWRYTVDYLRTKKHLHNLLYAYSTDYFATPQEYAERYPGDAYVDVLGFDLYDSPNRDSTRNFVRDAQRMAQTVRTLAQEKHKVWAVTETGSGGVPLADWWTQRLLPIVQQSGAAYVLVWRNQNQRQFFAPYPGQASAADFRQFAANPTLLLGKKAAAQHFYAAPPKGKKK